MSVKKKAMMYDAGIRTALLIGIAVMFLPACTASQAPEATATQTILPVTTSLPPPQAVDLGTLGKGAVSDVFWSPDGSLLAVRSSTGIHLHDTQTWEVIKTIPDREIEDRSLGYPVFSSDGKNLVFVSGYWNTSGAFWRYDLQSGEFSLLFEDTSLAPRSAPIFSPDGGSFAILNNVCENSGTEQRKCWDVLELRDSADGQEIHSLQKSAAWSEDAIMAFIFSPDGKQIAVASRDNFARVWDTASGKILYELQHDSDVFDVAYSPDGKTLASASNDATVRFWDSQTGENLSILSDFTQGLQRVAYLDQGRKLLTGELYSNRFQEYKLNAQSLPVEQIDVEVQVGQKWNQYRDVNPAFTAETFISPDVRKMAVLLNETVQVWDLETGKSILTLPEYHGMIYTWAFNSDASMLAAVDHNIHLWDVPSKKWLTALPINAYEIQAVAFSPDGKQLVVSAGGVLMFWDTSTFQKLHEVKTEHGIDALVYMPDGKYLATAGNGQVHILDPKTGIFQQRFTMKDAGYTLALNFSADGKRLYYAGSTERIVGIWNRAKLCIPSRPTLTVMARQ